MPDTEPFQIDYHLTRKDLVSFWRERWGEPSFRRGMWTLYAVVICWMVGNSLWSARGAHPSANDLLAEIAVESGIVITFCALTKWWLPPFAAFSQTVRRGSTGSFSIRISPQSLTVRTQGGERDTPWRELVAVKRTTGYLLLCERSGKTYTIPVHAFPASEDADLFYRSAHDWHTAAKSSASA